MLHVLGVTHVSQRILWPNKSSEEIKFNFDSLITEFLTNVRKQLFLMKNKTLINKESRSIITNALCKLLCIINKFRIIKEKKSYRILVVQISKDHRFDYAKFINCAFSAQNMYIPIDAYVIGETSSFLQQASYLTKGFYYQQKLNPEILQKLLSLFLPSTRLRKFLFIINQSKVDFRAICSCHNNSKEKAFVCPVCLYIYCKTKSKCDNCSFSSLLEK